MTAIFITAFISFFCGAAAVCLFVWWLMGYFERKDEKAKQIQHQKDLDNILLGKHKCGDTYYDSPNDCPICNQ